MIDDTERLCRSGEPRVTRNFAVKREESSMWGSESAFEIMISRLTWD
jgi:hypothetical protein